MATQKRKNNVQFLRALIAQADCDPMLQLFIVDALSKCAAACANADASAMDSPLINGAAWKATAQKLHAQMLAQYGN